MWSVNKFKITGFSHKRLSQIIVCSLLCSVSLFFQTSLGQQSSGSTTAATPTSSKFVKFDSLKQGVSVEYPSNWNVTEDATGVWFVSPVDQTGNIRLESQPSGNISLNTLVQAQLIQSKNSYKELKLSSSNMTTLAGNPANRTDYKFKVEVPKFLGSDIFDYTAFQVSAIKGHRMYTFTYFSTPENFYLFLPIAHKMLSTLKIL